MREIQSVCRSVATTSWDFVSLKTAWDIMMDRAFKACLVIARFHHMYLLVGFIRRRLRRLPLRRPPQRMQLPLKVGSPLSRDTKYDRTNMFSATANSTPISTPSALPYIGRKNFKLIVNGNFSIFVDHSGSITTDPALAQLFYIDQDELITQHGYRVGAASDGNSTKANVVLAAQFSALPYSTKFSLQSQGTNPMDKRQAVGLTSLVWTNAAFAAPTTAARFCIFNNQVYAILQSGGVGANFDAGCVTATISIYYSKYMSR